MNNFIITLLFGWLGVHKFMHKKYGMGILYLFTLGLFGIGWAVDTIIAFAGMIKGNQQAPAQQNQNIYYTGTVSPANNLTESNQNFGGYGAPGKQLIKSFDTVIVGTFAKCDLDPDEKRQDMIGYVRPKWELYLKFWRYKGEPAYYVCHPNGVDLGCVRAGLAKILYEEYSDCEFKVTAISRFYDERENESFNIRIDIYR